MSTVPTRPAEKREASAEDEKIIRERLATYERDKKDARPWPEVKAEILRQLKDPARR